MPRRSPRCRHLRRSLRRRLLGYRRPDPRHAARTSLHGRRGARRPRTRRSSGPTRRLGWLVAAQLLVGCVRSSGVYLGWFAFDDGGNETADKFGRSAVLALLAGLIAATGLLLARRIVVLTTARRGCSQASPLRSRSSGSGTEPAGDGFGKVDGSAVDLTTLWATSVAGAPALHAAGRPAERRFVCSATLDGVELVASRGRAKGATGPAPCRASACSCVARLS